MFSQYKVVKHNVTLINNVTYSLYNDTDINYLNSKYPRFIENNRDASFFDWLFSMGTNFSCFVNYYDELGKEDQLDNTISIVRTIVYAITEPFRSPFFYWTLLLLFLHKFNFRKPVMKIILAHFILRCTGDVLDKFGDLMSHYFATDIIKDKNGDKKYYDCIIDSSQSSERNPLKWFLTRQIGNTFWYTGEIAADWYPLLRTRAVAKEEKSMWLVYISCALFNISKIVLISIHYVFLTPNGLYDNEGVYKKRKVNMFYFGYWINQFVVIITSLIYDFTVFYVLKKNIFGISKSEFGFLKKFRTISEYRIIVSLLICIFLLPIILVTYVFKFYYKIAYDYDNLDFSFDEVRKLIANVQYFMIFIDQIFLLRFKDNSSYNENTALSNIDLSSNSLKRSRIDSKIYYGNLFKDSDNINSSGDISDHPRNSLILSSNLSSTNTKNSLVTSPNLSTRNSVVASPNLSTRNSVVASPNLSTRNSIAASPNLSTRNSVVASPNLSTRNSVVSSPNLSIRNSLVASPNHNSSNVINSLRTSFMDYPSVNNTSRNTSSFNISPSQRYSQTNSMVELNPRNSIRSIRTHNSLRYNHHNNSADAVLGENGTTNVRLYSPRLTNKDITNCNDTIKEE